MNKTVKQLRAQRRRQRKKDAKKEAEARMTFEGPGPAHAIKVLSDASAGTTDWDAVIQTALDEVRITQKEIDEREHILGLVERTLKPHYPRTICRMFGSSETQLGFKDSNTDIHLSIGYDPYNNTTKKEGREKASKLVRQLADCFKGHPELTVVGTHVGGRSPLVKLHHAASKTRVDLSLGNVFAVANSSLVRLLCNAHPQVRPFIVLLRLWAITQEVAGRGRPKFRLTNFVLTRLALFTCMAREQRLVPSLDDLRKQPYISNVIEGWECGHGTDVTAYWEQQEKGPPTSVEGGVLALALEFFEMYAGLDSFRWAVCPLVGRLVDRQIIRRAAVAENGTVGGPESNCDTDGEEAATDDDNDRGMVTEDGVDDSMITDKDADESMITDKSADDTMITDKGPDDAMITDMGVDDIMITHNGPENTTITDKSGNYTMVTDKSIDDAMITEIVRTAAAVTTTDVVTTVAAVTTTDADATAAAVPTTDAVAIAFAVSTTDAVAIAFAVTTPDVRKVVAVITTDAVAKDVVDITDAVAPDAAVTTDAVVEKNKVMTDTTLEGATHITDTVTKGAAVAIDNLAYAINHVTATNDNAATASNNVSSTETDSAADDCNNSLPEVLLPHLAKIAKRNRCAPLCVMDLFALDTNFTYQYHALNVKSFQEKCRKSAEIIKEVLKQERSLSALFTKIEISS